MRRWKISYKPGQVLKRSIVTCFLPLALLRNGEPRLITDSLFTPQATLTGFIRRIRRGSCPSAAVSTTYPPPWAVQGLRSGCRVVKQTTNQLHVLGTVRGTAPYERTANLYLTYTHTERRKYLCVTNLMFYLRNFVRNYDYVYICT
jgi:hypothetical protein